MKKSTIVIDNTADFPVGSALSTQVRDKRWWKRFLHWLFRKPSPTKTKLLWIVAKSDSTLTVTEERPL